ncbi:MAG TPA: YciI family protein [Solirubrobacteraceae bacterium]|nr:YciI family protein [Solirubrobacteraceae bacterium]
MRYALVIYNDSELNREPEDADQVMAAIEELLARPNVTGWLQLAGLDAATTVRHDQGRTLLTDGPFIESKDYLGGLINIEVDDLDGAIAIAGEFQAVRRGAGAIEIRPVRGESPAGA